MLHIAFLNMILIFCFRAAKAGSFHSWIPLLKVNRKTNFLFVRAKPSKKKLVKVTIHKGDILIRANKNGTRPNAPLAHPNLLWPSGIVEFKFYRTFPR